MANYYRIRKEWNNGKWDKTQAGAFLSKDQAILKCTQQLIDQGYKVFNPDGKIIYPMNKIAVQMQKDGITKDVEYWSDVFDLKEQPNAEYVKTIIERYQNKFSNISNKIYNKPMVEVIDHGSTKIFKVPTSLFRIEWFDKNKRNTNDETHINAGFFGNYKENGIYFTLPSANLVCDIKTEEINPVIIKYLKERKLVNGKLYFSANKNSSAQFRTSNVSTLIIMRDNKAYVKQLNSVEDENIIYAVSGAPIIRNGSLVKDYKNEGWDTSITRPTWHTFIGLTSEDFVYVFGYKSCTLNCITSEEIYDEFYDIGFNHLIKLDGGGSAYARVLGNTVYDTSENRQICSRISF